MNTKRNWTKSISVAVLVALAAFATTGLVLADHGKPLSGVAESSLTSFNQYQAAIDHMEEDQAAALTRVSTSKVNSADVFEQYNEALAQSERERNISIFRLSVSAVSSADVFEQYSEAIKQAELDKNASLEISKTSDVDDGMLFWEQYFKYAK